MRAVVVDENKVSLRDFDPADLLGSTEIEVHYSDLNYKDALVLSGRPGVVKAKPLIAGIDLVGKVTTTDDPRFSPGQWVLLNGAGLSENRHGGYAQVARIDSQFAVALPQQFSPSQAGALGTAGYTAALAVLRLEANGLSPECGPILVTGASGGVGSIATMLLAQAGYEVVAATRRVETMSGYLTRLGASQLVESSKFSDSPRPLQSALYAGAIDTVGGEILANLLTQIGRSGTVAACGLAGSYHLPTTVMPFILRGVQLSGIDSVWATLPQREAAWGRLARDINTDLLDEITDTVSLDQVIRAGEELLQGQRRGRCLVRVQE